ncbi:hypothetical protein E3U47_21280 [Pseudomonas sp. RIT623]|nr:hypothetical protein E3U47_21280 [Pseudomonas sp. RIT623]
MDDLLTQRRCSTKWRTLPSLGMCWLLVLGVALPCSARALPEHEGSAPLGTALVVRLQGALQAREYYRGEIDGLAGAQTQQAIYLMQLDFELPLTGSVNARLLRLLDIPAPAWLAQ